jgi:hypothetical protein
MAWVSRPRAESSSYRSGPHLHHREDGKGGADEATVKKLSDAADTASRNARQARTLSLRSRASSANRAMSTCSRDCRGWVPDGDSAPGGVRAVYRARPYEAQGPDASGTRRQAGGGPSICTRPELDAGDSSASPATGSTASITAAAAFAATSTGVAASTAADVRRYPNEVGWQGAS